MCLLRCSLGWAIAHRSIIAIFNNVKAPYNISRLTAEMALKAMSEDGVTAMKDTAAKIVEQKHAMIAELEGMEGILKVTALSLPPLLNYCAIFVFLFHCNISTCTNSMFSLTSHLAWC